MDALIQKSIIIAAIFILAGCTGVNSTSEKQQETISRYDPDFNFTPKQEANASKIDLTVAIIEPTFNEASLMDNALNYNEVEPFKEFKSSLAATVDKILLAEGLRVLGPYNLLEEITFREAQNIDLNLSFNIDLTPRNIDYQLTYRDQIKILEDDQRLFSTQGRVEYSGSLFMEVRTNDKILLWKEQLDIKKRIVDMTSNKEWNNQYDAINNVFDDVKVYNSHAKMLEDVHKELADRIQMILSAEELKEMRDEYDASASL